MERRGRRGCAPQKQERAEKRAEKSGKQIQNRQNKRGGTQALSGGNRGGEGAEGVPGDQRALRYTAAQPGGSIAQALSVAGEEQALRRNLVFNRDQFRRDQKITGCQHNAQIRFGENCAQAHTRGAVGLVFEGKNSGQLAVD